MILSLEMTRIKMSVDIRSADRILSTSVFERHRSHPVLFMLIYFASTTLDIQFAVKTFSATTKIIWQHSLEFEHSARTEH